MIFLSENKLVIETMTMLEKSSMKSNLISKLVRKKGRNFNRKKRRGKEKLDLSYRIAKIVNLKKTQGQMIKITCLLK